MNEKEAEAASLELYQLEVQKRELEAKGKKLRDDIHQYMRSNRIEEINGYAYKILKVDNPEYAMPDADVVKRLLPKLWEQFVEVRVKPEFRTAIPPEAAEVYCPIVKRKQYITLRFKNEEKQNIEHAITA